MTIRKSTARKSSRKVTSAVVARINGKLVPIVGFTRVGGDKLALAFAVDLIKAAA